jgi:hypothetical protein
MSKKIYGLFILVGLVLLPVAANASSASPAWGFTSVISQGTGGTSYALGDLFTPTQNMDVYDLGYYDAAATEGGAVNQTHSVALYQVTGGPIGLGSTTITNASTQVGDFLYNAITPVELLAGTEYELVGVTNTADYYTYTSNVTGFSVAAPITFNGYNENTATFAGYDGTSNRSVQYFGPDFEYTLTPEPTSFLLLGSGLVGLAGLVKRKLKG